MNKNGWARHYKNIQSKYSLVNGKTYRKKCDVFCYNFNVEIKIYYIHNNSINYNKMWKILKIN